MNPEQLQKLAMDPRMSPDAVRVVLYLDALGPGEVEREVKGEELAILLHGGEKPIRAAIARAAFCGYLSSRRGGRSGHKLTLLPDGNDSPQGALLKNDSPQGGIQEKESLPQGRNSEEITPPGEEFGCTISQSIYPSSLSVTPRAKPGDAEVDRLRRYLGEFAGAVDLMLESADHGPSWVAAVLGKYSPGGTQIGSYAGIPSGRWPAVLADALTEYATHGKPYDNRLFDGFIRRQASAERRGTSDGRRDTRRPREEAPRAASPGASRRSGWVYE